jgi:hypothetical protein
MLTPSPGETPVSNTRPSIGPVERIVSSIDERKGGLKVEKEADWNSSSCLFRLRKIECEYEGGPSTKLAGSSCPRYRPRNFVIVLVQCGVREVKIPEALIGCAKASAATETSGG